MNVEEIKKAAYSNLRIFEYFNLKIKRGFNKMSLA